MVKSSQQNPSSFAPISDPVRSQVKMSWPVKRARGIFSRPSFFVTSSHEGGLIVSGLHKGQHNSRGRVELLPKGHDRLEIHKTHSWLVIFQAMRVVTYFRRHFFPYELTPNKRSPTSRFIEYLCVYSITI